MAKKGALKSTLIVTSDELKVNGGRWLLQSGPAIRVRGFNSDSIGDRKIIGGDALPIYVLAESDARVNGGQWLLKGGQPIQVTDVIGSARGVIQGNAIPVWPVDDNGNYDADFAGGFLPTDISGLVMWLAADLGLTLNNGDPVTTWLDQSGNGNDVTQAVAGKKPTFTTAIINGKPVVRFDGAGDYLKAVAFALNQPEHVFLVMKVIVGLLNQYYFDGDAQDDMAAIQRSAGANFAQFAGAFGPTVTLGTTNFRIINALYNGALSNVSLDGGADNLGNVGAINALGVSIGGNGVDASHSNFDLAEFLIYDVDLSADEESSVETYLSNKYGIALA